MPSTPVRSCNAQPPPIPSHRATPSIRLYIHTMLPPFHSFSLLFPSVSTALLLAYILLYYPNHLFFSIDTPSFLLTLSFSLDFFECSNLNSNSEGADGSFCSGLLFPYQRSVLLACSPLSFVLFPSPCLFGTYLQSNAVTKRNEMRSGKYWFELGRMLCAMGRIYLPSSPLGFQLCRLVMRLCIVQRSSVD